MQVARYRVTRLIKRGGVADVFEAFATGEHGFQRRVALKQLRIESESDERFIKGFIDEAKIASSLHHQNIVGVMDFGTLDGAPFQILEFVEGIDVTEISKRTEELGISIPTEIALHVSSEVAQALSHAHEAADDQGQPLRIVHRDVSPHNILVSWTGEVKLADFGIAYAEGRLDKTRVGYTKGKLTYMAPEQAMGDQVDARTDVFSLGCVLHYMLAGESPLASEGQRNSMLTGRDPELAANLPEEVRAIIERATRYNRAGRYQNAAAFSAACAMNLTRRLGKDPRGMMKKFMERLRPASHTGEKPVHRGAQLLDVGLVLSAEQRSGSMRRFASVVGEGLRVTEGQPPTVRGLGILVDQSAEGLSKLSDHSDDHLDGLSDLLSDSLSDSLSDTDGQPLPADPAGPDQTGPDHSSWRPGGDLSWTPVDRTASGRHATPKDTIGEPDSADPEPEWPDYAGQVLHGYQLLDVIGKDAMSRVYRASHLVLPREYAVKVLYRTGTGDEAGQRLRIEAQALAKIRHPNVLSVVDFGITEQGHPFLTTELAAGRTLEATITEDGPVLQSRASSIARQIASGLQEAHKLEIAHCDLKPRNVLLVNEDGREVVKLFDFGIARAVAPGDPATRLTVIDHLLGTPMFMAPEQIAGSGRAGARADLYSLGVIIYFILAGKPPFKGSSAAEIIDKQLHARPAPLPPSGGLETLVAKLLEKNPNHRPANAGEVIQLLDRLGLDHAMTGHPEQAGLETRVTLVDPRVARGGPSSLTPQQAHAATDPSLISVAPLGIGAPKPKLGWVLRLLPTLLAGGALAIALLAYLGPRGPSHEPRPLELRRESAPDLQGEDDPGGRPVVAVKPIREIERSPEAETSTPTEAAPAPQTPRGQEDPPPRPAPRRKSEPRSDPRAEGKDWSHLNREVERELRSRGLTEDDLEATGIIDPIRRWRDLEGVDRPALLKTEHAALLNRIRSAPIDAPLLKKKIERVSKALKAAALASLPKAEIDALENRYLDLQLEVTKAKGEDGGAEIAARIEALRREIAAASRSWPQK